MKGLTRIITILVYIFLYIPMIILGIASLHTDMNLLELVILLIQ